MSLLSSVATTEQTHLFSMFTLLLLSLVVVRFFWRWATPTVSYLFLFMNRHKLSFCGVLTDNFICVLLIRLPVCSPNLMFEVVISVQVFLFFVPFAFFRDRYFLLAVRFR